VIIIGVDHNNVSYFIAFNFVPDQSMGTYTWLLAKLKDLFTLIVPLAAFDPGAIKFCCDQAFRNAISTIFLKNQPHY
jgi:hypothetical protein